MSLPILQTKLFIPRPRSNLVPRTALLARLPIDDIPPLTLISAPAGFGKTTLVGEWIQNLQWPNEDLRGDPTDGHGVVNQKPNIVNPQVAWLSLGEDDNEPIRWLSYLITALQTCQPQLGETALALLTAPQPPPLKNILTLLLNELSTWPGVLLLVLDDYHTISEPAIHDALAFLIDHLPATLRLILTSRVDPPLPLARWRVRKQLTELRADALRFTHAEVAQFLNEAMPWQLQASEIAKLEARTEGWIAGLHLAVLSMQGRSDLADFIDHFAGSHAYIIDYLVEEVLQRQPLAVQHFLLQTSILERLCGSLCDHLTGQQDGQLRLEQLQRANLFLIALDDERRWFRYHHLFAGMLQQRLRQAEPERIAELHGRASRWFETQGLIGEAVAHARSAGDQSRVIQLVEQEIRTLIMRGYFDMANHWLATLPAALIEQRPRLLIAQAWLRLFEIPFGDIEAALRQAERILAQSPEQLASDQQAEATSALLAEIAALRAAEAGISGRPLARQQAQEALRLAGPENLFVQSIISYALASFDWDSGQWPTIQQTFQQAIRAAQSTGNVIIAASVRYNFAMFHWQQGDLAGADALLNESERFTKSQPNRWPWPIVDSVWVGRGRLCYERNELDQALQLLQEGIPLAQRRNNLYVIIDGYLTLAWLYQAQGDKAQAQRALDQAIELVGKATRPGTPLLVAAHQARLWLAQGEAERSLQWAQAQTPGTKPTRDHPARDLALAAIYIAHGPITASQALTLLDRLTGSATEWAGRRLQIYALQALAFYQLGQPEKALQTLRQAVDIGERAGYVRLLVDQGAGLAALLAQLPATPYLARVLAAFGDNRLTPATPAATLSHISANQTLIEPLSERELEVLRLVVANASNQEIADRLVITVGTVKNHMTNILGKLGVRNRWEAIRKTEELGLV